MNERIVADSENSLLLKSFNNREPDAFGTIYRKFHKESYLYAASLYHTDIDSLDAIQDVFMYIWQHPSIQFEEMSNLKAFIFIAIKNRFKNYLSKLSNKKKYELSINVDSNFEVDIIESNIYSYISEVLNILPVAYAEVIKLYIEGWTPEEISRKLNKKTQTIYNIKQKSINILKSKIDKYKLFIILGWG